MAPRYSKAAQKEVKSEMHKYKQGKARSGPKLKKVKSREQAIAIGLSKARKKGAKVPKKPTATKKKISTTSSKKKSAKKTTARKGSARPRKTKTS